MMTAKTPDDVELLNALRKLLGGGEQEILRSALRGLYRATTFLEWRSGGPASHAAAKRERDALRAARASEPVADEGDAA
jgi:hypothetical protein